MHLYKIDNFKKSVCYFCEKADVKNHSALTNSLTIGILSLGMCTPMPAESLMGVEALTLGSRNYGRRAGQVRRE